MFYQTDTNQQALEVLWRTDGYKLDHVNIYPENTTLVYSNFTPRSIYRGTVREIPPVVVMFGLKRFLTDLVADWDVFFRSDIDVVAPAYKARVEQFAGVEDFNVDHIYALHKIGYLPLEIKAIPEGALGLIGQPVITVKNTLPEAFWLVNYIETWLSTAMWHPITAASIAWNIRRLMDSWTVKTGGDPANNGFQAHDFSYRGMTGWQAATVSGAAHLLSFTGSDSLSAVDLVETTYPATDGLISGGVPATEHAVMTANAVEGEDGMDESDTIRRILDIHPTGIVSVVSDSYDYWKMLTETLPSFKAELMGRDGKWVVRPDSGDPVKIVTGDPDAPEGTPENKGSLEILWDTFGGTVNEAGYRELDSHIGMIYGDSMNYNTIERLCRSMEETGFATSNLVFGLGSYSYQGAVVTEEHGHIGITRDTLGFAYKATAVKIGDKVKEIFKDPKTSPNKKSARGFLRVVDDGENRELIQQVHEIDESLYHTDDVLQRVFVDGKIQGVDDNFQDVRARLVDATREAERREWI